MIKLFLILSLMSASEPIGKLKETGGDVSLIREKKTIIAETNQTILDNDEIKTGEKSYAVILLADNSELKIEESSDLFLRKELLMQDTAIEKALYSIKLLYGRLVAKIEKKKEEWVNVGTPTSIIGVRGTEFYSGVAPDGSTIVEVVDGEVEVLDEENKKVAEGERAEYDAEEGLKVEAMEKEINWDEWFEKRRGRFLTRKDELAEIHNKRLEKRVKKLESLIEKIEKVADEGESEKMREMVANLYTLKDNLETGVDFLRREKLKVKIEKRFRDVAKRWAERKKIIAERFEKRRREMEEKFQRRKKEMEEKFKNRRKDMEEQFKNKRNKN